MVDNKFEDVEVLLEGLDDGDINSLITTLTDVQSVKRKLVQLEDMLKDKVKAFLKERKWERYDNENNTLSAVLSTQTRQKVDMPQLKLMLTEAQLAQVLTTLTFEKLSIITPEVKARLKNYVRKKKKVEGTRSSKGR